MTKNPDHAHFAEWDAAYVLGGLSPADRREFEDHLEDCERCRAAVQELSALPGLLGRIDDARAFALLDDDAAHATATADAATSPETAAPTDTAATVIALRAHQRRRRARRIGMSIGALAAAAALASVLTIFVPRLLNPEPLPDAIIPLSAVDGQQVPVSMTVSASEVDWGTKLDIDCFYKATATADGGYGSASYSLWVLGDDGSETSVSTWKAPPNTDIRLDGGTALAIEDIAELQLRTLDGGQTLLKADIRELRG